MLKLLEPNRYALYPSKLKAHRFCVAPMLDWTDRHCRFFHRLLSEHALLYTEMVTTGALLHGDAQRFLQFNIEEHPLALQLGGSNPHDLARCAKMAEDCGYDEVNLNVGCPSPRVQNGSFGACLMTQPQLVADCLKAMVDTVALPVTVKCRIGVDERDSYAELVDFIARVSNAGCQTFIIHARKAWLSGLSPKENREIPPLCYERVYQIKNDFPQLAIVINGGITSLEQATAMLTHVDAVMLGREVYQNPYILAFVDNVIFAESKPVKSREQVISELMPYLQKQLSLGLRVNTVSRHVLGLFNGLPGARAWRRHLSENATKSDANERLLLEALKFIA